MKQSNDLVYLCHSIKSFCNLDVVYLDNYEKMSFS